jgi:hypothetical protein
VAFCFVPGAEHHYQSGAGCTGPPFLECNFIHIHALCQGLKQLSSIANLLVRDVESRGRRGGRLSASAADGRRAVQVVRRRRRREADTWDR